MPLRSLSRDRWRALEPLVDAALDLAPAERTRFLLAACGQDTALRSEAARLLAACDHADEVLDRPAAVVLEPLLRHGTPPLPRLLGGRYHVVREIGRGGMATVYLAEDPKHQRHVAIKMLHAHVAQLIGRERFLREIAIAGSLSHPHILPLHDSGEVCDSGNPESAFLYSVSPFVPGDSLRGRLQRESRLATDQALALAREVALALDYAHRQGVVHLDVKPENILLQDGHAVIADFGIARAMSSATEQSLGEAAPLLGTPSYMSPEQASGATDLDGRSDVYSLGCVLYEMITGIRPHGRAARHEGANRARRTLPPSPSSLLAKSASRDVAAIVARAMMPERERRFQTAGELACACATVWAQLNRRRGRPV